MCIVVGGLQVVVGVGVDLYGGICRWNCQCMDVLQGGGIVNCVVIGIVVIEVFVGVVLVDVGLGVIDIVQVGCVCGLLFGGRGGWYDCSVVVVML